MATETSTKKMFDLVEQTHGPHKGKIHRSEMKTQEEVDRINSKIEVIKWVLSKNQPAPAAF